MDDEPLEEWAERRDRRVGRLRAVHAVTGEGPQGAHVDPEAPRVIERWNGYAWEPHLFAASLAEAKAVLYPPAQEAPSGRPERGPERQSERGPEPGGRPLRPGRGRHRKPRPGEAEGGR
ncbi:DUF6087 family protein [Streptomyces sp. WMMC1477]|uniref:DUF6087 family protein n=1 Tax=Streptomyces sp. WMMC1477 TaxID=3015155 RepID=UPI0022B65888|nr:DUF6087 family protein [Streptomyces sp. WMMC1477]MCZ7431790.1 DUF6087 family protein [Streptomyces sp. WMMC1477]